MTKFGFTKMYTLKFLIAQLVERQTSNHEVVGRVPLGGRIFLNLNLHSSPRARAKGVSPLPPPLPSQKKTTNKGIRDGKYLARHMPVIGITFTLLK